jgi:S1-C subfamily serine protease
VKGPSKNTDTPAVAHPRRLDPPAMLTWQSHAARSRAARGIHGCTTSGAPTVFGRTLKRLAALALLVLAGCGASGPPRLAAVRVGDQNATGFEAGAGRVVTVAHVLQPGRRVLVAGRPARVRLLDRRLDIAVLDAAARGELRYGTPRAGEPATVLVLRSGVARSLPTTVRRTITAHLGGASRPALELAGAVQPGDSGSPVLDREGRLLGVVFAQSERAVYALDARALQPLGTT